MTGKDVLLEKNLLEIAATIKRFEYSPLRSELKKKLILQKKTISKITQVVLIWWSNKKKMIQNQHQNNKSNLIYDANHSFYKYRDIKKIHKLPPEGKCSFLASLLNGLDKVSKLKPQKEETKEKKNKFV